MVLPLPAIAANKPHADCGKCHKDVKKKNYTLIVAPDKTTINPRTKKPFGPADAFCLGCHIKAQGNLKALNVETLHSVGVIPKKVTMPKEALGFAGQEKEITCLSCHNPHPDNNNPKFLRWPPGADGGMGTFCIICHKAQAPQRS